MNEQAWKEQAAQIIREHHRTIVRQPSRTSQPRKTFHNGEYEAAEALYLLVQHAIAAERGEPVAWMYRGHEEDEFAIYTCRDDLLLTSGWTETPLYPSPPTEAQIRADESERCAKRPSAILKVAEVQ